MIKDETSAKNIRNQTELLILLNGHILEYDYIYSIFEISSKTFKRDILCIKETLFNIYDEDTRLIKIKGKLAYKLLIPHRPILLL